MKNLLLQLGLLKLSYEDFLNKLSNEINSFSEKMLSKYSPSPTNLEEKKFEMKFHLRTVCYEICSKELSRKLFTERYKDIDNPLEESFKYLVEKFGEDYCSNFVSDRSIFFMTEKMYNYDKGMLEIYSNKLFLQLFYHPLCSLDELNNRLGEMQQISSDSEYSMFLDNSNNYYFNDLSNFKSKITRLAKSCN